MMILDLFPGVIKGFEYPQSTQHAALGLLSDNECKD
jgi:hypothetical protein